MNIESSNINRTVGNETQTQTQTISNTKSTVKFADELDGLKKETGKTETETDDKNTAADEAYEGLNSVVEEINKKDMDHVEDKNKNYIKEKDDFADNKDMINNDINIQDNKDILPQMSPNMNFSGNGQPFSSFMNNEDNEQKTAAAIDSSAKDLAEEAAILSTMAENKAIANKNNMLKEQIPEGETVSKTEKTVAKECGIKEVSTRTGITIENIVKFDNLSMNEADVEVFTSLVQNSEVNMNNLAPQAAEKSVNVSKTLGDMLAKSMENNQPLRIDFDNNISVIIRVSRDGKLSADFLPNSQAAEAYLRENLPILKQKFEDNNLEYDELNQRERRDRERDNDNQKKGRSDE